MTTDQDADMARVIASVHSLIEHFDSVQIFVTRRSDDGVSTRHLSIGRGDWFARYGKVKAWIVKEEQAMKLEVKPDEDDED